MPPNESFTSPRRDVIKHRCSKSRNVPIANCTLNRVDFVPSNQGPSKCCHLLTNDVPSLTGNEPSRSSLSALSFFCLIDSATNSVENISREKAASRTLQLQKWP